VSLDHLTFIGPLCYQGKPDCEDVRCRRMVYRDEPHVRPGCMGYHCSYCDAPCSSQGHRCDAANAVLGEARRIADEARAGGEET
jgi:hypothetical protein